MGLSIYHKAHKINKNLVGFETLIVLHANNKGELNRYLNSLPFLQMNNKHRMENESMKNDKLKTKTRLPFHQQQSVLHFTIFPNRCTTYNT
jgi:hypothetical protein